MPCNSVNSFTNSVVRSVLAQQRGFEHNAWTDRLHRLRITSEIRLPSFCTRQVLS